MKDYNVYSDAELIELLRNGDRLSFTVIYDRYKKLLYIFAFKRLGNKEEVNDLLHELFLSLWLKREELSLTFTLSTYLYTAVRNRIINIFAHKQVSARYMDSFNNYVNTGHSTTDYLVRNNELSALIEMEIAALPKKMRQVFDLSRKTNYTRKEIAKELGLSEQTVKSHMQHALKILKIKLGSLLILLLFIHL